MADYSRPDRDRWEQIFRSMPPEWYDAPPSDAMHQCLEYFRGRPCARLLDIGCGFGRWAAYLAGMAAREVVGVDYAERGIRAAAAWARDSGFSARFVVASATGLPFGARAFDGLLAAVVLDNLSREHSARAVQQFNLTVQPRARGFFVFNPIMTSAELAQVAESNPTRECRHAVYEDAELAGLLTGWSLTRFGATRERFRVVEATFTG